MVDPQHTRHEEIGFKKVAKIVQNLPSANLHRQIFRANFLEISLKMVLDQQKHDLKSLETELNNFHEILPS